MFLNSVVNCHILKENVGHFLKFLDLKLFSFGLDKDIKLFTNDKKNI